MIVNILIFIVGLAVYAGYGIPGLLYLAGGVLLSWGCGLLTPKWRWAAWVSILLNSVSLLLLKLQPVTGISWISAVGLSYFTLQIISYNADIYKGKHPPEKNLFYYALHITWIPHILLGPIERYDAMVPQLRSREKLGWDGISQGVARILWGLFKKLVIAGRISVIISAISADTGKFSGAFAALAMLLYSLQLYSDFSGGIDMVLGASQMLGVTMSENFSTPYFSQSVAEFWRRWHMTLGSWLKDYIYIPLGGSRKGKVRKVINTVVTFLVSGLWHGVQYLLWGLFNGIFVSLGTKLQTKWKTVNRIGTFLAISVLWAFFVWPDAVTALKMIGSVFTVFNYGSLIPELQAMALTGGDWIVLGVALLILWAVDLWGRRLQAWFAGLCPAGRLAFIGLMGMLVMVFGMYGLGFNAGDFIYGQF